MRSLRGKLDYGEDVSRFSIGEKIITLSSETDVSKYRLVKIGTESEDFPSDTEIV